MANWRNSRYPGVYVAHSTSCPAFSDPEARCRCKPSWCGRRWDAAAHKPVWGKTTKDRSEVLVWLAAAQRGADHLASLADRGPTFGSLGDEWLDGVERGHIGRRRGKGRPYSDTTIDSMRRRWQCKVRPEFGDRFARELTEIDWQRWIDQLARHGRSRSSIAQLVSLASGIYASAAASEALAFASWAGINVTTCAERRNASAAASSFRLSHETSAGASSLSAWITSRRENVARPRVIPSGPRAAPMPPHGLVGDDGATALGPSQLAAPPDRTQARAPARATPSPRTRAPRSCPSLAASQVLPLPPPSRPSSSAPRAPPRCRSAAG
jgi:hypothetical protein